MQFPPLYFGGSSLGTLGTEAGSHSGTTDLWGLGQMELCYNGMSSTVTPTSPSCCHETTVHGWTQIESSGIPGIERGITLSALMVFG